MKKTLLVLGAGASKDIYHYFPTGIELIKDINSHLTIEKKYSHNGEDGCYLSALTNEILRGLPDCKLDDIHLLKQHLWDHVRHYEHEYLRFNYGKSISIDYFILNKIKEGALNEKSKLITQYAISYLLIGCEEAIKDIIDKKPDLINKNWISSLIKNLSPYSMGEINENLTIVSFNYERTFAHLFSKYKAASASDNNAFYKKIIYIYDSLGDLNKIPFGLKNDNTIEMAEVYKNFHLIDIERELIMWSFDDTFDKIIFLGFGYDPINLKNLNILMFPKAIKIGTGNNFENKFKMNLKKEFGIEILPGTCTELIEKHVD